MYSGSPPALQRGEIACVCIPSLERLHICVHGPERQPSQVRQVIGADGGPETLLAVATKVRP